MDLSRRAIRWLAFGILVTLLPTPTVAQTTSFNPWVVFGLGYINDVSYRGESGRDDYYFRLGMFFPLVYQNRRTVLSLTYSPYFERFQDFSDLNNIGHRAWFEADHQITPSSSIGFTARYRRTQDQGDAESDLDDDFFLIPRSDIERKEVRLAYRNRPAVGWGWGFGTGWGTSSSSDIEAIEEDEPFFREDKESYWASIDVTHALSRSTDLGLRYQFRRILPQTTPDEDIHIIDAFVRREVTDRVSGEASLGWFLRERELPGPSPPEDEFRDGIVARISVTRRYQYTRLTFFATHGPSGGGFQAGTANTSAVGLTYGGNTGRYFTWSLTGRWAFREPTNNIQETYETISLTAYLERRFFRRAGIRFRPAYMRQIRGDDVREGFIWRGIIGVVWYPLEKTRLGQGI